MSWLDEAATLVETPPEEPTWTERAARLRRAEEALGRFFESTRARAFTMERRSYDKIPEQTKRTYKEEGYETPFEYDVEKHSYRKSIEELEKLYPQTMNLLDKKALSQMHKQTHRQFRQYSGLYKEAERMVRTGDKTPRRGFRDPQHLAILTSMVKEMTPEKPLRGGIPTFAAQLSERLKRGFGNIPSAEEFIGAVVPSDVERVQQLRARRAIRRELQEPLGGGLVERGVGGALELAPEIAVSAATGAITPAGPILYWGGRSAIDIEDSLIAEGITGPKAKVLALAGGAAVGALEMVQLKPVTKPFKRLFAAGVKQAASKTAKQFVGRKVKETAFQVGIEGLQSLVESGARAAAGADVSLAGAATEALSEMVHAAEVFPWLMLPGTAIDAVSEINQQRAMNNLPPTRPADIARAIAGAPDSSTETIAAALKMPAESLPAELQNPKEVARIQSDLQDRMADIEKAELYGRASEVAKSSPNDRMKAYGERVKTQLEQGKEVEVGLAKRIGREYDSLAVKRAEEVMQKPEEAPAEKPPPVRPDLTQTPHESLAQDFVQETLGGLEAYYSGIPAMPFAEISQALKGTGENLLASFEKAYRLKKISPEMHERLRAAMVSRGYFQEVTLDFIRDAYRDVSAEEGELILRHQEDPKNNPLPEHLKEPAELTKNIIDTIGAEIKRRKMSGLFPESFINRNMAKIDELEDDFRTAPDDATRMSLQEEIDNLLGENAALEELGYVPHFVELSEEGQVRVAEAVRRSSKEKLRSVPKEHLGRKVATIAELEEMGMTVEKDIRVAMARYMSYMMHKIAVHDFNQQVQREGLLAKRAAEAPADWVDLPAIQQYKGWKVHPAFAEAVQDWTAASEKSGAIGTLYDKLNSMAKQLKFYNFLVMTWNNIQQGFAAAGPGFFQVHPIKAAKELVKGRPVGAIGKVLPWNEAFMEVSKKGPLYRAALAADLFTTPADLPGETFAELVRSSLDAIDETQPKWWRMMKKATGAKNVWDFTKKTLPVSPTFFGPQNAYFTMQRHLTWWLDRVARMASLMRLVKKHPFHEAVRRARMFHADYNIMRQNASKIARRTFLTPAYQTAMWYKLFPEMMKNPKKYAGPLARIGLMYGTMAGVMAQLGYAWTEGYRFVREDEPEEGEEMGKERVVTMFGPFSEPFKAIGRIMMGVRRGTTPAEKGAKAIEAVLYNKLAALPHSVVSLVRNRDWKGNPISIPGAPMDEQLKSYGKWLLREIYPITEQVSDWSDEEQTTVNNVLRAAAIMSYTRKPQREWNHHKMRTKLAELRAWARRASKDKPANSEYYHKKAARLYGIYVETLAKNQERHEKRLAAIKREGPLKKLLRQIDYFSWLPVEYATAKPQTREKQVQLRLWEYTSRPRRKKDESDAEWNKREQEWKMNQQFLGEFFQTIDIDLETARKLLVKEGDRRNARVGERYARLKETWERP